MALIAYSLSLRTQFIGVSDVLFAFVEAKLRASAKQMFSHVDARYVSQTNSEMEQSGIEMDDLHGTHSVVRRIDILIFLM